MFTADQTLGGSRWPLVRVQVGGCTDVVLLASRFLPLTVHWVGRSVPCCGVGCALCAWLPGRGLFYLPVMCQQRVSILELASLSSSYLEQHCKLLHQGVRPGLVVRVGRRSRKSPVTSEVIDERSGVVEVSLVEFAPRVMALYQLPGTNPGESLEGYSERLAPIMRRRSEVEFARLKKAQAEGVIGR